MSPIPSTLLTSFSVVLAVVCILWIVSVALRDVSIADPFWGVGFAVVAWLAWWLNQSDQPRVLLLAILTTVWGLRLCLFLIWRNWGQGEDRRYAVMRSQHGQRFWYISLVTVFLLQGVLLWFVSLPVQVAAATNSDRSGGWLDCAGVGLWSIGLFFEVVGDWQLASFKAAPGSSGRVMDRGLWRYTRHPNYFGDFCVWWGLYLISANAGTSWTIASPLVMSLLLMKVSGVRLLESTIEERRPDYAAYKARTNAFFPGAPRNKERGTS